MNVWETVNGKIQMDLIKTNYIAWERCSIILSSFSASNQEHFEKIIWTLLSAETNEKLPN